MSTINSSQDVRFQLREDLEFVDYSSGVGDRLVVRDPLQLEYFLFESFEKILLSFLRCPLTAVELKSQADRELAPNQLEPDEVNRFLQRLWNDNLVIADNSGVGNALWLAHQQKKKNVWFQRIFGILAIRFRGVNPQAFLDLVNPVTRALFHPVFLVTAFMLFFVAVVTASLNVGRIFETDYLWKNLSDPRTLIPIALALMIVKILHELGHALACRSVGRDCHELGVMLLAFVPCLYCNVSDMWMEPNRCKRMLVSAAGIYVEMLIAAVCVPLWLMSNSGPVQVFWFAMATICSVNTLLINGNPLLRYDGYYLLSDWLGVPNLSAVSQQNISNRLRHFFFRGAEPPQPFSFLDVYGVASKIYRTLILCVIIFAIYTFFERLQLPKLGGIVATSLGVLTFGASMVGKLRKLRTVRMFAMLRMARTALVLFLVVCLIGIIAWLPITPKIYAVGETSVANNGIVYAPENGRVIWAAPVGSTVKKDQAIAEVVNDRLRIEFLTQRQRIAEIRLAVENQKLLQSNGADNSREIELQKDALASALIIQDQLQKQIGNLTITAAVSGKLVPLPQLKNQKPDPLDLNRRASTLKLSNAGAFVNSGEPLALILDASECVVRLNVPEKQIDRVFIGQTVKLLNGQSSPEIAHGKVEQIALDNSELRTDRSGHEKESGNDYVLVIVKLNNTDPDTFYKSKVHAAIIGSRMPVYEYGWQLFTENFDF